MCVNTTESQGDGRSLLFLVQNTLFDSPLAKSINTQAVREREREPYLSVRHTFRVAWFFFFPESKKKKSGRSERSLLQKL